MTRTTLALLALALAIAAPARGDIVLTTDGPGDYAFWNIRFGREIDPVFTGGEHLDFSHDFGPDSSLAVSFEYRFSTDLPGADPAEGFGEWGLTVTGVGDDMVQFATGLPDADVTAADLAPASGAFAFATPWRTWSEDFGGIGVGHSLLRTQIGFAVWRREESTNRSQLEVRNLRLDGAPVPAPAPEPSTLAMAAIGGLGLVAWQWKRSIREHSHNQGVSP